MNKGESIALYRKGRDAWNAWALETLERRSESQQWGEEARASFKGYEFAECEDFRGFVFPGTVSFDKVRFRGDVDFREAEFKGLAQFSRTNFKGAAMFDDANFERDAWFTESDAESDASFKRAAFEGDAWFNSMRFGSIACFERAVFHGSTDFSRAKFRTHADFLATRAHSAFMMSKTSFSFVPKFEQAQFTEAPRLDGTDIDNRRKNLPVFSWIRVRTFFRGNQDDEAQWRSLKKMALQGRDHLGVQRFFREELLARRGVTDKYWQAPFWFGIFYQCFSDFGRSFGRPCLAWTAALFTFAALYSVLSHEAGLGDWQAAFGLSLHHNLASLSGLGSKLPDWYLRLYGEQDASGRTIIPDGVSFLGVVQSAFPP